MTIGWWITLGIGLLVAAALGEAHIKRKTYRPLSKTVSDQHRPNRDQRNKELGLEAVDLDAFELEVRNSQRLHMSTGGRNTENAIRDRRFFDKFIRPKAHKSWTDTDKR